MQWNELTEEMAKVETYPILEPGDYLVKIRDFAIDHVKDFHRLTFFFLVDQIGEAIPNKITLLFPMSKDDQKSMRTSAFKWRNFCACFGFDPKDTKIQPSNFLNRTGRVRIGLDNWGYTNVKQFLPREIEPMQTAQGTAFDVAQPEMLNF